MAKRRQVDAGKQARKIAEMDLCELRTSIKARVADDPTPKEEDDALKQWDWQNSLKKTYSQLKAVWGNEAGSKREKAQLQEKSMDLRKQVENNKKEILKYRQMVPRPIKG